MMAAIFAAMLAALYFVWRGKTRIALVCLVLSFALALGLFLFEIHSPDYGFRMPWISVSLPSTQGEG